MRILRSLADCKQVHTTQPSAVGVTLGNFDGMHLGHQSLFSTLRERLRRYPGPQAPVMVLLSFRPHPKAFFAGLKGLPRDGHFQTLTSFRRKAELAAQFRFQYFFAAHFNSQLAALTPEKFVEDYLVSALGAQEVVVGHDWCFGKDRAGTPEVLRGLGEKFGFEVTIVPPFTLDGDRVSSGQVREGLARGELSLVRQYLGRHFELTGKVIHGDNRGHSIGYPTANLSFEGQVLPKDGVYATNILLAGVRHSSVTNVGLRPTFGGGERFVETHVIGGSHNLYGKRVRLEFIEHLRGEKKFSSVDELKQAIGSDVEKAKIILAHAS